MDKPDTVHRHMYQSAAMAIRDAKYTNRFPFTAKIKQVSIAHLLSESMPFIVVKMQSACVKKKKKKREKAQYTTLDLVCTNPP